MCGEFALHSDVIKIYSVKCASILLFDGTSSHNLIAYDMQSHVLT
jgi:hypothetical protein